MIIKEYMKLGLAGGAHGFRMLCDACRRAGPFGMGYKEVLGKAAHLKWGLISIGTAKEKGQAHLCPRCLEEWPTREKCTDFINRKRRNVR